MAFTLINPILSYVNEPVGVGIADSSITISDTSLFPSGVEYPILIDNEVMYVTGVSGYVLSVTRAQEGTAATVHSNGAAVTSVWTAAELSSLFSGGGGGGGVAPCGGTVTSTTNTGIPNGGWAVVPANGASTLFGGATVQAVAGTDVGICPGTAGTYMVMVLIGCNTGNPAGLSAGIAKNGTTIIGAYGGGNSATSGAISMFMLALGATDYVGMSVSASVAGFSVLGQACSLAVWRVD